MSIIGRSRFAFFLGVAIMAAGRDGTAQGGLITTFQGALQPTTPALGWSYLYNGGGAIGNPANYTSLQATTDPTVYYDDGGGPLPGPNPGAYVYFGLVPSGTGLLDQGQAGGHPGRGSNDAGSGGIERFAIAAYTLGAGGTISLTNTLLTNVNASTDGLDLRVYVDNNPTPFFSGSTGGGQGQSLSFDTSLGALKAGDTIYVAIGSRSNDSSDGFSLNYGITSASVVPEPSSLAMCGIAFAVALVAAGVRRRGSAAA